MDDGIVNTRMIELDIIRLGGICTRVLALAQDSQLPPSLLFFFIMLPSSDVCSLFVLYPSFAGDDARW